jgi:hypothetical protein
VRTATPSLTAQQIKRDWRSGVNSKTSFRNDILPLFTERDIVGMRRAFDLTDYAAVRSHAKAIRDRIRGIGGTVMPPPPPVGDGPWPQSNIDLFNRWMADGCPP